MQHRRRIKTEVRDSCGQPPDTLPCERAEKEPEGREAGRSANEAQPARAAAGTPVAKQFHGYTRVGSLGTKDRGGIGQGFGKAGQSYHTRKEGEEEMAAFGGSQEAVQALLNSKKPGSEEQKTCHPNRQMCSLRVQPLL